jgi:hypothetical protein
MRNMRRNMPFKPLAADKAFAVEVVVAGSVAIEAV